MIISLKLINYRNIPSAEIELSPHLNIIFGENGVGKSNLLESAYICGFGRSFRGKSQQLVKFDSDFARVDARNPQHECIQLVFIPDGERNILFNNKKMPKISQLLGKFPITYVGPHQVMAVAGSPVERRELLDSHISQFDREYLGNLRNYIRCVHQRNAALRGVSQNDVAGGMILIDSWDEKIALNGASIIRARMKFIAELAPICSEIFSAISGNDDKNIELQYKCSVAENPSIENLEQYYLEQLKLRRNQDFKLFQTTIGPHRDDIKIKLDGLPARNFASWGQVRMIALALYLSSARIVSERIGRTPTILLDDALAELDPKRAQTVLKIAPEIGQIMVATPHPSHIINENNLKIFKFNEPGKIIESK
ncbi:DNA replication/repair protein RecF [bacterium]|nr:DNA replication/repair protein RecF [bacterium]